MSCTYFLKDDNKAFTYSELVEFFQNSGLSEDDTVYSKDDQQIIYDRLAKVKLQGKISKSTEYGDGEPNISDDSSISIQEFIDSYSFTFNGKSLITKMNRQNYIDSVIAALTYNSTMTEDEARYIANQEIEKWDTIGQDASDLHTLLSQFNFNNGKEAFQAHLANTRFANVSGQIYDSFKYFLTNSLGNIVKQNGGVSSKVIHNVNLKAEIEGLDKELFGHIDMIAIDGAGDLHLFNYKIATTLLQPTSVKLEKYRYQMALLKQMLANKGFKVRNATLNIVPIKIGYNEDYTQITSAVVDPKPIEFTFSDGKYVFSKYDTVAQHFISSTVNLDEIQSTDLDEATRQLQLIFPDRDIAADGLKMTAQEWIRKNRYSIFDSSNPEYAYEIEFGENDVAYIKSHAKPEYNTEIIEEVLKRQELLNTNQDVVINRFIKSIRAGFKSGSTSFLQDRAYSKVGPYLSTIFNKYFPTSKETPSDWTFLENDILNGAGILLFKHKNGQLDVVITSPYDLDVQVKFKKGGNSILGGLFTTDTALNQAKVSNLINYKNTYGNVEAVRAMILLNQILPKLEGNFTLGKLQVLSLQGLGQGIHFNIESFNKECFSSILKVLNNNFPETKIKNNFTNYKYVSLYSTILQEYESIIDSNRVTESESRQLVELGFDALASADTITAKLTALRQVELAMRTAFPELGRGSVKNLAYNGITDKNVVMLYQAIIKAITYYSVGDISPVEQKISSMDKNVFISSRVPNRNFKIITDLYTKTLNSIAEQVEHKWIPIRQILFKYYDEVGYSRAQNTLVGGQVKTFEDLYKRDSQGNNLLRLLNPYDEYDMAQITSNKIAKQKFLKKVLFEFAKVRYPRKGITFKFSNEDDPLLLKFIEEHRDTYFNIPLEKASISTRRATYSIKQKLQYMKERVKMLLTNPQQIFDEMVANITPEEKRDLRDASIESIQLQNKFDVGEGTGRSNYIATHGVEYFETNLETLLADFIERDIETKEYAKSLVVIKGILFQLDLLKDSPNQKAVVEQTTKMIEDFVKINMFNISIMDETSQNILGVLAPFRKIVSNTLIAGNVVSMLRDTFEGAWQNSMRSIIQFQTDIDKKSLIKAYKTVVENSFTDGRSINIVNQLCQIYRLSNIDVSRISEGLKTERGLVNAENWAYATLRRPDFLNRMTLFVAKCYKDGVYGAFDIKDGQLVYDWRKDERFKIYASKDTNKPKYLEQMGAYYNAIRAYNLDHPENTIGYNEDLPLPYSLQEIETMKTIANSIYGSYDKSTRSAYEHMALGTFLGMFSTWMNGIYSNYMMKPGQYTNGEFTLEQATDESGNLLFFDITGQQVVKIGDSYYYQDSNVKVETDQLTKLVPVMNKVPIVIQGIYYTLKDAFKSIRIGLSDENTSILNELKTNIWLDPIQRKNIMKLSSDLLAWLLFSLIFRFALSPAYKEFKKGMKERNVAINAGVELLYKASSRSYDGFRGIYNVFEYLGENTNPPVYTQNIKIIRDLGRTVVGDRTIADMLNGDVAVFRSFQDTWRATEKE